MLNRILALLLKELLILLKNPRARLILIAPPIIQSIVFSFAATLEVRNVTIASYNLDQGQWGLDLIKHVEAAEPVNRLLHVYDEHALTQAIDQQLAIAAVVIPQNFSADLLQGKAPPIQIILDGRKANAAQIVAGYLNRIIRSMPPPLSTYPTPQALLTHHLFNPNLLYTWFTVPSLIVILSTLVALLVTALSVAREKEMGTFEQLRVSPLRPSEILAGKASAALLVGIFEATLILLVGILLFKIPFTGSLPLLYAALTVFLLSVIGVGLFLSSLCNTQQQAILGAFIFMVIAVVLSGFASPIENMPHPLQELTRLNPLRYFMIIARGLFLKDIPLHVVASLTAPLLAIAATSLTAATLLFNRNSR